MGVYLGIDTSNYTTSVAIYDSGCNQIMMEKKLLPVREHTCGLRQSDAVFLHVKQLGDLVSTLFSEHRFTIDAIGYSAFPRNVEGSYMPCFLVGDMVSQVLSEVLGIPRYRFSHQQGHVAAALYSADCLDWIKREFYAFHVSGGTTEALLVKPGMEIKTLSGTLDLNAGQAIDRVGVMLGCSFPCGAQLEQLADKEQRPIKAKATLKGLDCCLSGVQNQCEALLKKGETPSYIAKYCICCVQETISQMTKRLIETYGEKPLLYAGGVMSNRMIREYLSHTYHGKFAQPQFSSDNSAGVAVLTEIAHRKGMSV
jgi:N6-L-threonylcarbamoyladenine synthase